MGWRPLNLSRARRLFLVAWLLVPCAAAGGARAATPSPAVAVAPNSDHHYIFWRGSDGRLHEAWNDGVFHGPISLGWPVASSPSAAVGESGHQYVFWRGGNGDLHESWYIGGWHGPVDLMDLNHWGKAGVATSSPSVAVNPTTDHQYVFWLGTDSRIHEAWYDGKWHGPIDLGWHAASAPAAAVTAAGHQYVFWRGGDSDIHEARYAGHWHRPQDLTRANRWGSAGKTGSAPGVTVNSANDHQYVFWRGANGHIAEGWYANGWHGPVLQNWTASSSPAAAVARSGHQWVYWQSTDGYITEAFYRRGWTGPVARWSLQSGGGPYVEAAQTTADLAQRMSPLANLRFSSKPPPNGPVIDVNDHARYQRVDGVGGAMTDSTAYLIHDQLSPSTRGSLMRDLFGPYGIHLNYIVLPIGGSDFTRTGVPYTYDDLPKGQTDPQLTHFSIAHDQRYIIPTLQQMRAINPQSQILAVPWSPPAWMKANNALNDAGGLGTLLPSALQPLADYFVNFLQAYASAHVTINAIAPENEPNAWSLFPAMRFPEPDEARWLTQNLAPALAAAKLTPKVFGGDTGWGSPEFSQAIATTKPALPISGVAWHCYGGAPTVMNTLHAAAPSFEQPVAECAQNLTRFPVPEVEIGAFRNWASAVTLWNLALDPTGSPVEPPNTGCGGCRGIVTIDTHRHNVTFNLPYYQLGQVGAFVQPNAQRIGSNSFVTYFNHSNKDYGYSAGLDDVAFLNPDGSRVLVAYNTSASTIRFSVAWKGRSFTYSLPAKATITFRWDP